MKNTYVKYSFLEIKNSLKRFLTLVILSLLGLGFFVGIKSLGKDMQDTAGKYFETQNMYDVKLVSTLGLEEEDLEAVRKIKGVETAYGTYTRDAYVTDRTNETYIFRINSIQEGINDLVLTKGRMPENIDECVVEKNYIEQRNAEIGDYIDINIESEDINLYNKKVKIVGIVESPIYISRERGFTDIGNGRIRYFLYVPIENFNSEIYTEIYIKVENSNNINIMHKNYEELLENVKDDILLIKTERENIRKKNIISKYIEEKKEYRKTHPIEDDENYDPSNMFDQDIREYSQEIVGVELTKEELNQIMYSPKCNWNVSNVFENQGVVSLKRDTISIVKLANIFPVIFFLFTVLITLTTMNRMIEEQRKDLGILKYLGYNIKQITMKYIIYELAAIIIGGIIGVFLGNLTIPQIVWEAYKLMYHINTPIVVNFNIYHILFGFICIIASTYLATIYTIRKEIDVPIAELLKPKKERIGKRILLEKFKIWKKINFKIQILCKNISRYKKRFIITTIGVIGTITLVIAGFGLYDAITQILNEQERIIYNYDLEINLNSSLTGYYLKKEKNEIESLDGIESCTQACMKSGTIINNNNKEDIQIIIPSDNNQFNEYIKLVSVNDDRLYELEDNSIAITQKVAEMLNIQVGDTVTIASSSIKTAKFKVGAIVKNYISHYVYIPKRLYLNNLGSYTLNTILAKRITGMSQEEKDALNQSILLRKNVKYSIDTDTLIDLIDNQIGSLNYTIIVLIVASCLLNFAVQYNLYNLSLSERKKELMTLKTLGYSYKSIYKYMNFEIIIATVIGIVVRYIYRNNYKQNYC